MDTRQALNNGVRLRYELREQGWDRRFKPWLALISGVGFDRTGWAPILDRLGRQFRLVLIDNRGVGQSDAPVGPYFVAEMADDVIAVLDHAGVTEAHVLGASLGGMVAQQLAIRHPQRVARLVLACTTRGWLHGHQFPVANALLLWEQQLLPARVSDRHASEHALSKKTVHERPDLVDALSDYRRAASGSKAGRSAQAFAGAVYSDLGHAGDIAVPTLVIAGSDDRVVDPRNATVLADAIPNARLEILPDAGHLLFWEQPDEFLDAVEEFLLTTPGRDRPLIVRAARWLNARRSSQNTARANRIH